MYITEVKWSELMWSWVRLYGAVNVYNFFFSNYVFRWEYCIVILFLYNLTHGFFTWSGLVFCVFCVVLFFYVMVQFSVLLYSSVILYCSLLFILLFSFFLLCVCTWLYMYRTLTLPPGVNQVAVNKYLTIRNTCICCVQTLQSLWCKIGDADINHNTLMLIY